jgi:hypoxanthine phosphoribosyltransferase
MTTRAAGMLDDVAEVLLDAETIGRRVRELGAEIARDYAGKDLVLVSILKGALPFLADLMRAAPIPLSLDFLEVSSYGYSTETSGVVRVLKDLANPIEGRHVLIVEDVVDTGLTLNYVMEHLKAQHPASMRLCALLDKPARRIVPLPIDYRGFEIPDKFVVGYGLDFGERYRNLPFIGVLKPDAYERASDGGGPS